ncbi:hypothetical protein [Streptococcus sp. sy010]|uniref:hypothetical protein n=1 Tax=Streptococcus sp. sy010 TaxID=2600148 RepID=UPI0011B3D79B|nr:hypothetical protein [Streptococcus sp. sy010]TWT16514.1 hypothetical protein FRX51_00960 [Streptococcus sp. sy010]
MSQEFATLDDIFNDDDFEKLVATIRPLRVVKQDPEVESFYEIMDWIREHGREPQKSVTNLKERSLFSRLKGIRERQDRQEKLRKYDDLGLLGDEYAKNT